MFRQAIVILAMVMFAIISGQDLLTPVADKTEDFNGNLSINAVINTNNEITHQQIEYEQLKLVENVDGILHYSIGARSSREYAIIIYMDGNEKGKIFDF